MVAAWIWVPIWSRLKLLSIFEYLEMRYHPGIRTFGATLFPIQMIFWIANALVTASMAFQAATGVDGIWCLVGIVVLGAIYTMLGGARAVIWTDVVQFLVFLVAYMVIGLLLLSAFDWDAAQIYKIVSSQTSKVTGYPHSLILSTEFSLAIEATIWAILFVVAMDALQFGTNQVTIQRMLATGKRRSMFKAVIGTAWINLLFTGLSISVAWGLIAFYHTNTSVTAPAHPDQAMPQYVVQYVPVLMRGLIMAGLLAAMMSSFDSALNSMSSVTINDFYRRYFARDRSEQHYVASSRYITLGWAAVLLLFSLWQYRHSGATALERVGKLNVLLAAPLISFFILGVFSKRTNTPGVLIGGVSGMVTSLALNGFPGLLEPWLFAGQINWMWIGGFSAIISLIIGYIASLLFNAPEAQRLEGLTVFSRTQEDSAAQADAANAANGNSQNSGD